MRLFVTRPVFVVMLPTPTEVEVIFGLAPFYWNPTNCKVPKGPSQFMPMDNTQKRPLFKICQEILSQWLSWAEVKLISR
jgi:hypothetical protein